ncbi:uncharacterized protein LOC117375212 [Periophthalmus magnuspinnatus]|nr:uncharacterized protein LOC117375212 [Periophthalmus magnuspinnatus]
MHDTNMAEEEEYMAEEEGDFPELEDMADMADFADNAMNVAGRVGGFISKVLPQRQCSIKIKNNTSAFILRNPRVHIDTGVCAEPLALTIKPSSSGEGLFTKSRGSMRGSGGVFTYDLYHHQNCVGKMAALFKVPYDLNLKSIVFAIGVFDSDTKCDKHLFHLMFTKKQDNFMRDKATGSCVTIESPLVTVSANMSNTDNTVMKIEISDYN